MQINFSNLRTLMGEHLSDLSSLKPAYIEQHNLTEEWKAFEFINLEKGLYSSTFGDIHHPKILYVSPIAKFNLMRYESPFLSPSSKELNSDNEYDLMCDFPITIHYSDCVQFWFMLSSCNPALIYGYAGLRERVACLYLANYMCPKLIPFLFAVLLKKDTVIEILSKSNICYIWETTSSEPIPTAFLVYYISRELTVEIPGAKKTISAGARALLYHIPHTIFGLFSQLSLGCDKSLLNDIVADCPPNKKLKYQDIVTAFVSQNLEYLKELETSRCPSEETKKNVMIQNVLKDMGVSLSASAVSNCKSWVERSLSPQGTGYQIRDYKRIKLAIKDYLLGYQSTFY